LEPKVNPTISHFSLVTAFCARADLHTFIAIVSDQPAADGEVIKGGTAAHAFVRAQAGDWTLSANEGHSALFYHPTLVECTS
jgi:hypothetical protein